MDDKDLVLLRELQADSNRTNRDIAQLVGVAPSTLSERIKKLQDDECIRRIGAVLNPSKLGLTINAFVLGNFKDGLEDTTKKLNDISVNHRAPVKGAQISEIHTLFGRYDVMFKVRAESNIALQALVGFLEREGHIDTETIHVAVSVLENSGVIIVLPNSD